MNVSLETVVFFILPFHFIPSVIRWILASYLAWCYRMSMVAIGEWLSWNAILEYFFFSPLFSHVYSELLNSYWIQFLEAGFAVMIPFSPLW